MNNYKKGNLYEREVKKILENLGWIVEGQHRRIMFLKGKLIMVGRDIFGCDLIAKKLGEKTRFIQVSTKVNKSGKIKQVNNYPWNYEHDMVEIWLRQNRKRIYDIYIGPNFTYTKTLRSSPNSSRGAC